MNYFGPIGFRVLDLQDVVCGVLCVGCTLVVSVSKLAVRHL